MSTDWIASSFDSTPSRSLVSIPIPRDEPWETIPTIAQHVDGKLLMGIFPAFLGIDLRFHRAVRAIKMPVCTFAIEQIPIAAALVPLLDIGAIVTTSAALPSLLTEVAKRTDAHIRYHVILSPHERPENAATYIEYEIQSQPGIVAFTQCQTDARVFHRVDVETRGGRASTFPLLREAEKSCACESPRAYVFV